MRMQPRSLILLCSVFFVSETHSQPLTDQDYQAGFLFLYRPINLVLKQLPKPKSIVTEDVPQTGGRLWVDTVWVDIPPDKQDTYTFDSLIIITNGHGLIDYFEFTTRSFVTRRGIAVGDSADKVRTMYGEPSGKVWLGEPEYPEDGFLSYFKGNSVQGIAFILTKGRVSKIIIGNGSC